MNWHSGQHWWKSVRVIGRWIAAPPAGLLAFALLEPGARAAEIPAAAHFRKDVQPLLKKYCSDCHADGAKKGGVAFDEFASDAAMLARHDLWLAVLKNTRAGLMPPAKKPQPSAEERRRIEEWIKFEAFAIDRRNPDPGRVTARRLNRVEYRNTIRDLLGVDFNTAVEFPPDDTGYGFDNIGDVLTVSPLLLEKYMVAAKAIVTEAVPTGGAHWTRARNYDRYFTRDVPKSPAARRKYAGEVLRKFATQAFRRPVDDGTVNRLVAVAEKVYTQPGKNFETGVASAMIAALSSPRFLFRLEEPDPRTARGAAFANVDEYSLASRLSYFLWSTMPDEELSRLAGRGELRKNLPAQIKRMLDDPRAEALVQNFTGQWLQTRDLEGLEINARAVLLRDAGEQRNFERRRERFQELSAIPEEKRTAEQKAELEEMAERRRRFQRGPQIELDRDLRRAFRLETEKSFAYVMHADRPVLELISCDYTFLNEKLASHYGLTNLNLSGPELRRVTLPADSPRGGVLTHGSVLVVTSNPDRTSPVKRGLFILDNILGAPAPPPPGNVPALEVSERDFRDHEPTLREALTLHREKPECASCHERMDPLGLAFENFNALGMWREQERKQPIDPAGKLITGETFGSVRELKQLLATKHRLGFYRCLTEKFLTYAIGRGMEYYDTESIDKIVQRLDQENGRFSALLLGVIESAPFQKMRTQATASASNSAERSVPRNETKRVANNQ